MLQSYNKSIKDIFNYIYDINEWASSESKSGPGSELFFTENTRKELPLVCKKYGIKRVLDIACGDFNWMKEIVHHFDYYRGTDIVERIIDSNIKNYQVKGKIEFEVCDIIEDYFDTNFDVIIVKDLLVHYPIEYILKILERFRKSGITYIFLTNFLEAEIDKDIETYGLWRPINFEKEPYLLGTPLEMIKEPTEGYFYLNEFKNDKTLSLWKLN